MILQRNINIIYSAEVYDDSRRYRLTITPGKPNYDPKVPRLSDRSVALRNGKPVDKKLPDDITVNFNVSTAQ
jgi:hypothetical protein